MVQAQAQAQVQHNISKVESLELVRCLLRVSLYHVSALRGLFPDTHFKGIDMRNLEGMHVKMLTPKSEEARRMIDWVEGGVYDAVKQGYLKTLFFGISRDPEGLDLFEEYVFSFVYGEVDGEVRIEVVKEGDRKKKSANAQVKKADVATVRYQVTRLMRMLVELCNTLDQVPENRYLFCRMAYYDHTPDEYEPPYFKSMDPNAVGRFSRKPFSMKVGEVMTHHHDVGLRIKSILDGDAGPDDDEDPGGSEAGQCTSMDVEAPESKTNNNDICQGNDEDIKAGTGAESLGHNPVVSTADSEKPVPPQALPEESLIGKRPKDRAQADLADLMTEPQDITVALEESDDDTMCPDDSTKDCFGDVIKGIEKRCLAKPQISLADVRRLFPETDKTIIDKALRHLVDKNALQVKNEKRGLYKCIQVSRIQVDDFALKMDHLCVKDAEMVMRESSVPSMQGKIVNDVLAGSLNSGDPMDSMNGRKKVPEHAVYEAIAEDKTAAQTYLDASQHSAQRTKRARKASFVVDPIHQTVSKATKVATRSRIGKMG